ncbi:MAG TPA: CapA family protein [Actinomycetota bacterium]|nr:CapA family protein [Actinomycetota bacterium]
MPGRHERSPRIPIWLVALILALAATATVAIAASRPGAELGAGPAGDGDPSALTTPSTEEVAADEEPEPAAAAPSPSAVSERRGKLLIHGTGDVSLDPNYVRTLSSQGYRYAFSGLDGLFRRDDLTVINLECAVSELGSPVPKEFNFRCDPDALPVARRMGVEVVNLGNNHAYDYGAEALLDSVRNARRAGLAPVGAGADQDAALAPAVFELEGWTVAVVGLDMVVDPYPAAIATDSGPGTAAGHDEDLMIRAIEEADSAADIVVVTIHWGIELDTEPRDFQVALGHRMVDAGADVIFGHHAHRLQPMEVYRGRPIFWGLGNFVWPTFSTAGSTTAVAEVTVTSGGGVRGRLLPAFISAPGHPVLR